MCPSQDLKDGNQLACQDWSVVWQSFKFPEVWGWHVKTVAGFSVVGTGSICKNLFIFLHLGYFIFGCCLHYFCCIQAFVTDGVYRRVNFYMIVGPRGFVRKTCVSVRFQIYQFEFFERFEDWIWAGFLVILPAVLQDDPCWMIWFRRYFGGVLYLQLFPSQF